MLKFPMRFFEQMKKISDFLYITLKITVKQSLRLLLSKRRHFLFKRFLLLLEDDQTDAAGRKYSFPGGGKFPL